MKMKKTLSISGVNCLAIDVSTLDEFIRFCSSIEGKNDAILYLKLTEKNRWLFKEIVSIASIRKRVKDKIEFLYKSGYLGICWDKKRGTYVFLGSSKKNFYELLLVSFE
jgi:hypothetical protein